MQKVKTWWGIRHIRYGIHYCLFMMWCMALLLSLGYVAMIWPKDEAEWEWELKEILEGRA